MDTKSILTGSFAADKEARPSERDSREFEQWYKRQKEEEMSPRTHRKIRMRRRFTQLRETICEDIREETPENINQDLNDIIEGRNHINDEIPENINWNFDDIIAEFNNLNVPEEGLERDRINNWNPDFYFYDFLERHYAVPRMETEPDPNSVDMYVDRQI